MRKLPLLWYVLVILLIPATAVAGLFSDDEARDRIQRLEARVAQLEKENSKLVESSNLLQAANKQQTGSMLDMLTQVESLNQELRTLRGQNEELTHSLLEAKNRQKDFYVDLDARLRKIESAEAAAQSAATQKAAEKNAEDDKLALENTAFDVVYSHYKAANYSKVIESSHDFLQKFPESAHVPDVQYLLGDAYFSLDDFKKSIASYQVIVSKFENSPKVSDAWLSIASCQQQLKDVASARKTLKLLINKYPDSKAAKKAVKRLKSLK